MKENACVLTMVYSCTLMNPNQQSACKYYAHGPKEHACTYVAGWKFGYPVCKCKEAQRETIEHVKAKIDIK